MAENLQGRISEKLHNEWETLESEGLKNAAVLALHGLAKHQLGHQFLDIARGGERVEDPRLHVELPGLSFENPVMVGAGWDEDGRAVDGLYLLGFAGTEVGTVTLDAQFGNPQPRISYKYEAALNNMGFNGPGAYEVAWNLETQQRLGVVGINLGRNKNTPNNLVAQELAMSSSILSSYADYFVINFQSPNTPGLRDSMMGLLKESILAVDEAQAAKGRKKPIFIKTSIDMSEKDMADTIQIAVDVGAAGIVDTNTTTDEELKASYGWQGQPGGLSGNNFLYRRRADERMQLITKESRGTGLARIGVGAISNSASAIERIQSGAQLIQVVTGIRQNKAKTAQNINRGILAYMDRVGINSVEEIVGVAV